MNSSPKIAHLATATDWRGGEQQLAYLLEEHSRLGVDQLLICKKDSGLEAFARENKIPYIALSFNKNFDFLFYKKLAKICEEQKIDLIAAHDSKAHNALLWSKRFFGNKSKIVIHRKVDFPVSKSSIKKYNHPSISAYIAVSQKVAEILSQSLQRPELVHVVYDGIDLNRFSKTPQGILRREYSIPESTPIIANIAALTQQKDYFTFIDTVKLAKDAGIQAKFLAIGEGKQKAELEAYAKNQEVNDMLIFTGFRKDITSIFCEIDILLFSSETEGLGTTVLDAMACGVPVVSTNAGGIPEIIEHRVNGYLAKVKSPKGLLDGLKIALNSKEERDLWVKNARQKAQEFSKERMAKDTLSIYRSLC